MSTYLIGDVQGCWKSLQSLLKKIHYQPGQDQLGFVGDLINRGPKSVDTLRFVMNLDNPLIVLGNHEIYALILSTGLIPMDRYKNTLHELMTAPDRDNMIAWLQQQPLVLSLPNEWGVMVHAGIPPQWDVDLALQRSAEVQTLLQSSDATDFLAVCFGNEPANWDESLSSFDRARYIVNAFTRMRFCTKIGTLDMVEKGREHPLSPTFRPWFDWQETETPIFFGHWAHLNGDCDHPHRRALDTGCVYGRQLTAIRLEDNQLVSVPG